MDLLLNSKTPPHLSILGKNLFFAVFKTHWNYAVEMHQWSIIYATPQIPCPQHYLKAWLTYVVSFVTSRQMKHLPHDLLSCPHSSTGKDKARYKRTVLVTRQLILVMMLDHLPDSLLKYIILLTYFVMNLHVPSWYVNGLHSSTIRGSQKFFLHNDTHRHVRDDVDVL